MTNSEIRLKSLKTLANSWHIVALITFFYIVINFVLLIILCLIPHIHIVAIPILAIPFSYGYICSIMRFKRKEPFSNISFLKDAISNIVSTWFIVLRILLKLLPYILGVVCICILYMLPSYFKNLGFGSLIIQTICFIAFAILAILILIKSFPYCLSFYILYDNPDMITIEIIEKSKSLMIGNKMKLFYLLLSYIGFIFLSFFTLGAGFLFLIPYIHVSIIEFYEDLIMLNNNYSNEKEVKNI